jgi:uncharacterized protein (TIGR02145 family)
MSRIRYAPLAILFLSICCGSQDVLEDPQGNVYKTTVIGDQEWMIENLLFDVGQGTYCYQDDPDLCIEMGRLYTWAAAKEATDQIRGWHLPTRQEWEELISYCGGDSAGYGKIVSDTVRFNPQWSGVRISTGVYKAGELKGVNYWSSTTADTNSTYAYSVAILSKLRIISPHNYPKENACSVRLIRDR